MKKDYFAILELKPGSDQIQIKSAYRKAVKKWHPDKNPSPESVSKFHEIHEAYEMLMFEKENSSKQISRKPSNPVNRETVQRYRAEEARARAEKYAKMRYEAYLKECEDVLKWEYLWAAKLLYVLAIFTFLSFVGLYFYSIWYVGSQSVSGGVAIAFLGAIVLGYPAKYTFEFLKEFYFLLNKAS